MEKDSCYFRHTISPSDLLPHLPKSQQLQNTTATETQGCKIQQLEELNKKIERFLKVKLRIEPTVSDKKNLPQRFNLPHLTQAFLILCYL